MNAAKQAAVAAIDARAAALSRWNRLIWEFGETAWREYRSADWYVERLRAEGFEVEAGSAGMPTAFAAEWSNGPGPVLMTYAEYDGLPGNCQQAVAYRAPRPGLSPHAGGHTDPHSALGIAALGGLLGARDAMQAQGLTGTLRFFGECAEKVRGSKPIHAAAGYYDGIDAGVSFHPCYMLPLSNTTRWDTHCGVGFAPVYTFHCDEPHTWLGAADDTPIPVAHSSARAPGANDAVVAMYTLSKLTRESMLPHTGGWALNEAILACGQATGDNLPAQMAQILYQFRGPTVAMAEQAMQVLDSNAQAAASATHCRVTREWVSKSRPGLANHAMAEVTFANLALVGAPQFGEEAVAFARELQSNLGLEAHAEPFLPACSTLIEPRAAERLLRRDLPQWQTHSTSDDYTEMCWHAPMARLYVGRPMLRAPAGFRYPDWAMNALGGHGACIDPMILSAARAIACTFVDLLRDPAILARARAEFEARTGGGVGGERWLAPLCDYPPPIDLPWPEYVTTARGTGWWIPERRTAATP